MTWVNPLHVRNASKQELIDFILSIMSEDEANQRFTEWALSPDEIAKMIEMMEG